MATGRGLTHLLFPAPASVSPGVCTQILTWVCVLKRVWCLWCTCGYGSLCVCVVCACGAGSAFMCGVCGMSTCDMYICVVSVVCLCVSVCGVSLCSVWHVYM